MNWFRSDAKKYQFLVNMHFEIQLKSIRNLLASSEMCDTHNILFQKNDSDGNMFIIS